MRNDPVINDETRFFWEATKHGAIVFQQCLDCGTSRHPPGPMCPACRSFEWQEQSSQGRGKLFSYIIPHLPRAPGFDDDYIVGIVELEEGIRLVTNIVGMDGDRPEIGVEMEVLFEPTVSGFQVPLFRVVEPLIGAD